MGKIVKLSTNERWILSNQYRIMEMLSNDKEEKQHYEDAQKILNWGYEYLYSTLSQSIYDGDDILGAEQGREVVDILSMFDVINHSYDKLADKSGIDEWRVRFSGFCGNEEAAYMSFAAFFCKSGSERFESLVKVMRGDGFNSHMPRLDGYRRMLAIWRPMREKSMGSDLLTKDEIKHIVDEQIHPEYRKTIKAPT